MRTNSKVLKSELHKSLFDPINLGSRYVTKNIANVLLNKLVAFRCLTWEFKLETVPIVMEFNLTLYSDIVTRNLCACTISLFFCSYK